jgi:hypothetical protein
MIRRLGVWILLLSVPAWGWGQALPPFSGGGGGASIVGGSCANQVAIGITVLGAPICAPVTSAMVTSAIAQTGIDINTAHQVTVTHLATPLPFSQGGHGLSSGAPGGLVYFPTSTSLGSSFALAALAPVLGGGAGQPPTTGSRSGDQTMFGTVQGALTTNRQLMFDAAGNISATAFPPGTPTQPGLTWGVNTSQCLLDSNGGKLTVNGSLQIICAADLGGATTVPLSDPGSSGVVVRTALGTTIARTITGTALEILVSEGSGVAGNPTLALAAVNGDPGTFSNPTVTVDTKGRITAITDGGGGPVCLTKLSNPNGIAGADTPISTTPFVVFTPDVTSCEGIVVNTSNLHALRCRGPEDGVVSATAGTILKPGGVLKLGAEARTGLSCIRDTSAPSDVGVTIAVSTLLIKP